MPPKGNPKGKSSGGTLLNPAVGRPLRPSRVSMGVRPQFLKDEADNITELGDGHDDEWNPGRTALVKPDDQLQLSEQELKEEFTRILTANNPHAPQNIVRYSFKERQFKQTSSVDQLAIHFALDGNLIHKDSDEAARQLARMGIGDEQTSQIPAASEQAPSEAAGEDAETDAEAKAEGKDGDRGQEDSTTPAPSAAGEKKLTNQFNFSERAAQTYNNPYRERGTVTEPPPRATYTANVTQWEIYDAYQEDFQKQLFLTEKRSHYHYLEKSKEKKVIPGRKEEETKKKKLTAVDNQSDDVSKVSTAAKIIERMVNQNTFDDITQDFKYYEDQSDEFRDQEGTLLPLWKFSFEKAKKLAVTSVCWSPQYHDMFAVGQGSYDFNKQNDGMILVYTLKNTSHPECIYHTDSGVMCLDFHKTQAYLICVGFYDGSVGVYNVETSKQDAIYRSTAKTGKHTDPVWQVRWQEDDLDNNLNFFSISSDGRVVSWTLVKNELVYQDRIKLVADDVNNAGPDGTTVPTVNAGTTFDFHPKMNYQFLVGTEEGKVHLCSTAYNSSYLFSLPAHHMAVYHVAWNHFHKDVFITCSADWTVKIWDKSNSCSDPMFTFDLNNAVGDVAWAPYSSTVFAAVTADGKVHVYDLNVNKYEAICEQLVTPKKKTKLTHVGFNPVHPILIVGDDRGYVTSLKLSPNLRKMPKEKKGQEQVKPEEKHKQKLEFEYQKFEKLLAMVRHPPKKN